MLNFEGVSMVENKRLPIGCFCLAVPWCHCSPGSVNTTNARPGRVAKIEGSGGWYAGPPVAQVTEICGIYVKTEDFAQLPHSWILGPASRSCLFSLILNYLLIQGTTLQTVRVWGYGGCRKFLLLFGRIGPLALRPCAVLRAWGFLPHSINILQIPWWYGDMDWYGMSCARPCALLRGPAFLMPLYHALKILSPPKMWLKGRGFL